MGLAPLLRAGVSVAYRSRSGYRPPTHECLPDAALAAYAWPAGLGCEERLALLGLNLAGSVAIARCPAPSGNFGLLQLLPHTPFDTARHLALDSRHI